MRPAGAASLELARAAAPLALAAAVYHTIPRTFFHGDDFLSLYEIANGDAAAFVLRMHGGHSLISSNGLFVLLFRLFGAEPAPYHWLAFLTHLLNVGLLYALVRGLTGSSIVACFGAALWGTLPVHAGSIGWYAVYGHVMATTCVLGVLTLLVRMGERAQPRGASAERTRFATLLACVVLLAVASTSFGVGIGVTVAMPVVAFCLLPPGGARRGAVGVFAVLAVLTPIAYFAVQSLAAPASGRAILALQRAALRYWTNPLWLFAEMFGYASATLSLGVAHRPAAPGTYVAVAALAALAIAAALALANRVTRARVFAFVVLAASAYGVIAVGRGVIGRGPRAAQVASSPRFHYLALAALTAVVCLVLADLGRRSPRLSRASRAVLPIWLAALLVVHLRLGPVPPTYAHCRAEMDDVMRAVQAAVAAAAPGADVHVDNRGFRCVGPLLYESRWRFPGWAGAFAIRHPNNVVDGRRVRFIESDRLALERTRDGRRTAGLLLSYEEVGRTPPPPTPRRRPGATRSGA